MKASQTGINLIKAFEGLRLKAYDDGVGVWTIGYGHTGPDVQPGMVITEEEAEALLRQDLDRFERAVSNALAVETKQAQFDAFVSLAFNIGSYAFQTSTALKRHNAGDLAGAAEAITWWNKAAGRVWPGLVRRRAAEAALYTKTKVDDYAIPEGVVVVDDVGEIKEPGFCTVADLDDLPTALELNALFEGR